ncbi:hypothetical protein KIPB_003197 [Kipferlia bialata]|uniref:Uncharacterized protein n=1 Tax=Kipferlia bialata TaxID=797122 RepID=A0A9K3CV11_9EUKA|nr:hypothetical protein KIPB_003197 [Kipferlia bialata]|eukprot:g3197.t1
MALLRDSLAEPTPGALAEAGLAQELDAARQEMARIVEDVRYSAAVGEQKEIEAEARERQAQEAKVERLRTLVQTLRQPSLPRAPDPAVSGRVAEELAAAHMRLTDATCAASRDSARLAVLEGQRDALKTELDTLRRQYQKGIRRG